MSLLEKRKPDDRARGSEWASWVQATYRTPTVAVLIVAGLASGMVVDSLPVKIEIRLGMASLSLPLRASTASGSVVDVCV